MESMLYVNGEFLSDTEEIIETNPDNLELQACPICARTFLPPALIKHVGICEKMNFRKRTPFDSFRQRREGTELARYLPSDYVVTKQKSPTLHHDSKHGSKSITTVHSVSTKPRTVPKIDSHRLATKENSLTRSTLRASKRNSGPTPEVCPHCERSFGIKAYDRHVEWCKEKSRLNNTNMTADQHLAKERLQARTNYRAPSVRRSKREKNREKYSSLSESMNNLSDGGSGYIDFNSVADERDRKFSIMSLSMTSSVTSECGYSDKYDPFISAKRQLEDLYSPTTGFASSTPFKDLAKGAEINTKAITSPKTPTIAPKNQSNHTSSFRRTSSLRIPKKVPKPITYMPKYKQTIQRGISDEGPISSNFLKPEEYDELPVKSHAIITPYLVPKSPSRDLSAPGSVIKRSQNTSANRRNLCLDLKNVPDFQLSKTDSLAAFLKYENDINCLPKDATSAANITGKLTEKELKDKSNSLNKQSFSRSSFAELLDGTIECNSNSNEQNDQETQQFQSKILPKYPTPTKLAPIEKPITSDKPIASLKSFSPYNNDRLDESLETIDSKLINSCDNLKISNLSKLLNETSISLNLSSVPSNETTNQSNATNELNRCNSTNKVSSAIEGVRARSCLTKDNSTDQMTRIGGWESDRKNPKRQLQFRKDNLLFDNSNTIATNDNNNNINNNKSNNNVMSIDDLSDNENRNKLQSSITIDSGLGVGTLVTKQQRDNENKLITGDNNDIESLFDDFDLEEFISSFNDNEQFPIFKNYKELGTNRSTHLISDDFSDDKCTVNNVENNIADDDFYSERTETTPIKVPYEDDNSIKYTNYKNSDDLSLERKDSISPNIEIESPFQSIESVSGKEELSQENKVEQLIPVDENGMSQAEKELLASVQELNWMCESPKAFQLDSGDELTSVDSYPFAADSAYGSLFRPSPVEKPTNTLNRLNQRNRQQPILNYQIPEIIGVCSIGLSKPLHSQLTPIHHITQSAEIKSNRCSTSSGSDKSLPPIITHKNNSQNIYDSINIGSMHPKYFNNNNNNDNSSSHVRSTLNIDRKPSAQPLKTNKLDMPKFCYECGAKFIVAQAKFCMECGVKRVILD